MSYSLTPTGDTNRYGKQWDCVVQSGNELFGDAGFAHRNLNILD